MGRPKLLQPPPDVSPRQLSLPGVTTFPKPLVVFVSVDGGPRQRVVLTDWLQKRAAEREAAKGSV
jgi:hypothetical protein